MRATSTGVLGLLALLLAGCPMTNQSATDAYARQVTTATMRVAQLEASLLEAEQRVEQLEEALRAQGQEQVTRLETVEQVNAEVARIRGDIEVMQFEIGELRRAMDEHFVDSERRQLHAESRLRQIEGFLGVQPPPPPTDEELGLAPLSAGQGEDDTGAPVLDGEDGENGEDDEQVALPEDLQGKLELAVEHMREGRHGVARAVLDKAVEAHPGAEALSEVRYRIAETWFNEAKWSKAISAFNTVIEGWPDSEWASWAMLRQGDAFDQWGQRDNAKLFYEEVVRVYPKSEAAKEAKGALDR